MSNYEEIKPRNPVPMGSPVRKRFNFSNNRLSIAPPVEPEFHNAERESRRNLRHQNKAKAATFTHPDLVFNVAQLLRDPEGATRSYAVEADKLALSPNTNQTATNIMGKVRFTRVRHEVLARGEFETDVTVECVRCLNDFTTQIDFDLEDQFRPSIDVVTGLPVSEDESDEGHLLIDHNHILDLGEALRQQILVSLPMLPLCREDCPGLYQYLDQANADVPEEEEEVVEEPVDSRWAALTKLRLDK